MFLWVLCLLNVFSKILGNFQWLFNICVEQGAENTLMLDHTTIFDKLHVDSVNE